VRSWAEVADAFPQLAVPPDFAAAQADWTHTLPRPHAALLCARAVAGLLLVPSGRWPAATGLLSGDKTFSEFVLVSILFQAGVARVLLRRDAAAFAAWRAVQAAHLKAKAE
jgi:hypothetical protein